MDASSSKVTTSNINNNSTLHQHHHHQLLQHHHHQIHQQQPQYQHQHDISFQPSSASPMMRMMRSRLPSSPSSSSCYQNHLLENKEHQIEDDLDEGRALFRYLHGQQQQHQTASEATFQPRTDQRGSSGMKPPTLNIFPSLPMHEDQTATPKVHSNIGFAAPAGSYGSNKSLFERSVLLHNQRNTEYMPAKNVKLEENRQKLLQPRGPSSSSEQEGLKLPDPKTLRRLAQNREAARKSRLRKKAYIQQLESSRIKLLQLEQELHKTRSAQSSQFGGGFIGDQPNLSMSLNLSSDAVVFDVEHGRWLEEHHKLTCELRAAFVEQLHENELRLYVNNWLAHFDQLINLKSMVAKTDPFHLLSGSWKSAAERCFLWIGGFWPSQIIKVILKQIEKLSDTQLMGIYGLQNSTQESEEALSTGLEALSHSLSNTIASYSLTSPPNDMTNYMGQMAIAINKLSTLEGFVRQADNLRQQTLHRLQQILTVRQAARCFLTVSEYFHSLRVLSSLWQARPRQE